jgi:hypothetical protein
MALPGSVTMRIPAMKEPVDHILRPTPTWDHDPRHAMNRELLWEYGGGYRAREDRGERLKDELMAIAELVENHREEFEALVEKERARRDWLDKKAALAKRPVRKTDPPRGGLL